MHRFSYSGWWILVLACYMRGGGILRFKISKQGQSIMASIQKVWLQYIMIGYIHKISKKSCDTSFFTCLGVDWLKAPNPSMFNFDHSNQEIELNWCLDSHICSKLVPNDDEWATNTSNTCNSLKISESTGKCKKSVFPFLTLIYIHKANSIHFRHQFTRKLCEFRLNHEWKLRLLQNLILHAHTNYQR